MSSLTPIRRVAVLAKNLPDIQPWLKRVRDDLSAADIAVVDVPRGRGVGVDAQQATMRGCDMVVVLGGDGTFLAAARAAAPLDLPVLGINLGSLGFLAEYERGEWPQALADLRAGRIRIEQRMMVACTQDGVDRGWALNDIVVTKSALARMIDIDVHLDEEPVCELRADGIIVATPVGSTAYNLSAGGPIVQPSEDVLIVTPICPHQFNVRPLVASAARCVYLDVAASDEAAYLTIDGQIGWPIAGRSRVEVRRAPKPLLLATGPQKRFYDILRRKLGWGANLAD